MSETTICLALQDVVKVFDHDLFKKNELAVDNISFQLTNGKCTGLLGHNGAGKTTSIKMILGLIKPTSGQITYGGQPLERKHLAEIGYMPETNKLSSLLTPYETLDYQMRLYRYLPNEPRRTYIQSVLESVGLKNHMRKRNQSLSKGMGRRLAFAFATIHKPRLLILDEPFSGLDPIGRDFMRSSIENFKGLGTTVLLCTHEVEAVKALCDDVVILREGKKVFDSSDIERDEDQGISAVSQYQVVLSGVSDSDVKNLQNRHELVLPEKIESRGFLHNLLFFDFEQANSWLRVALNAGVVVLEFRELRNSFGDNEDLLKYLHRENIK